MLYYRLEIIPAMAKFGLFGGNVEKPMQQFEGERMVYYGSGANVIPAVDIQTKDQSSGTYRTVAVVRLAEGQCVKEIK